MQKITPYQATPTIDQMIALTNEMGHAPAFQEGIKNGLEYAYEAQSEGEQLLSTAADVWIFLRKEFSPAIIQREAMIEQVLHVEPLPLEKKVGFLVGYLTQMFDHQ